MDFSESFRPSEALRNALANLSGLPRHAWFYVPLGTELVTLETACRACVVDSRELSPEEADELDAFPPSVGLKTLLSKVQLEDILSNLVLQRAAFSDEELEAALNHYWKRDAFINLG
jgi:hypothetical protein